MMKFNQANLRDLERFTEEVYTVEEWHTKLKENRPLRIKYGVDVTAPFLHIGHAVNLWMMRYMQEYGHKVVFLVGDFTTRIGDPTGKSQTRPIIPPEEIEANAQEFIKQVAHVLLTTPDVFEVRRNSEWYEKMGAEEFISLLSMVTHSKMIQRDMFQSRIASGREIYMHEMIYPVLQGYDSVMIESDMTIVGTDQFFNELMGRFYQEKFGQSPQILITTKITPGTDGVEKQSKSLGNYIALADTPRDKFGKIMSLPDFLIIPYFQVYTMVPLGEIREIEKGLTDDSVHPMEAKKQLAATIVERYHGADVAQKEERWFTRVFSERKAPEQLPALSVSDGQSLFEVLQSCLPDQSNSAIRRLIQNGGVRLNGVKVEPGEEHGQVSHEDVLQIGKRKWFKISAK